MPTPREQKVINKLDSMTIDEARKAIAKNQFGHKGTPDYTTASAWLAAKEANLTSVVNSGHQTIPHAAFCKV